jgi:hypothetical protein
MFFYTTESSPPKTIAPATKLARQLAVAQQLTSCPSALLSVAMTQLGTLSSPWFRNDRLLSVSRRYRLRVKTQTRQPHATAYHQPLPQHLAAPLPPRSSARLCYVPAVAHGGGDGVDPCSSLLLASRRERAPLLACRHLHIEQAHTYNTTQLTDIRAP